jgi:hypothetical protein
MCLRNIILLKYLVALLFVFELLAPAFVKLREIASQGDAITTIVKASGTPSEAPLYLLLAEPGQEEREGKHIPFPDVQHIQVFSELEKFRIPAIDWLPPKERNTSQPALYTLFGVLLI